MLFLRQLVHLLELSFDMLVFPQLDGEKTTVFFLHSDTQNSLKMFLSEIRILDHCFCVLAINGRRFLEKTNVSVYPVKVKSV